MAQVEVEFMGSIDKKKFDELKLFFSKNGKFSKIKERISFMYFRDKIPKDLSEIKDEPVDLRFRITNKMPEIVLKYGNFSGSNARKEVSLEIKREEIENYIEFLHLLGWSIGVINATKTYVYDYQGVEYALVEIKDYGYNFEAEILSDENFVEAAKKQINQQLNLLDLKPFNEKELNQQCNAINNKKELQFDFSKQPFKHFRDRFKDFLE